jgi:acyl dehydratase
MPLNQALVGKEYPPVRYEVGREKLREFAVAVGETDPVYHDEEAARAAGHPDIPAVPTFPVVLSMRAAAAIHGDPELGLDYSRVVHGEQEFVSHRPIRAGDRLLATAKVASAEPKGRHELLTIETQVTTEAGDLVCTIRGTLLSRGTAPARGGVA